MDAEPLGGLELGLVVVADAAFGHQARRLVGQSLAALAGARLRVLLGVLSGLSVHGDLRGGHDAAASAAAGGNRQRGR
ncbi:hypothetical protein GCM10007167_10040 [Vulcaniibacterium thermophilum]|uniref:Uncharacterized protein n=1 Tax=Vulcaniibacterium thermophilum TaxID=1169913 RepID=A0A918YYP8_9GAMM|nr:hypothetical protein GCM10007167_10040 [Vulcaniibacterium thermophilum]